MPFITKIVRDYANVNDPGVPFDGPGFHNGGPTSITDQGGGDGPNLDWVRVIGAFIGLLLLLLVSFLIWRIIKSRRSGGAEGPSFLQRLKKVFGGGGNGHHDHELGSMPPSYPHTGPGRLNMAKSEGSLPP